MLLCEKVLSIMTKVNNQAEFGIRMREEYEKLAANGGSNNALVIDGKYLPPLFIFNKIAS